MAVKDAGNLEDLEQEVTCPLCLGIFEDPRVLACQHTYCKSCLDTLVSQGRGSHTVCCPECRKPTDSAADFPVAFKINRLKQIFTKMQLDEKKRGKVGDTTDGRDSEGASVCSEHPGQALDVYCSECEMVVCRDCILFGSHASHPYSKLEVSAAKSREALAKKLCVLLEQRIKVENLAADIKKACGTVAKTRDILSVKVSESYDRAIKAIEQKKQSSLQELHGIASEKLGELKQREVALSLALSEIDEVQSFVEQGLKSFLDAEFMSRKDGMIVNIDLTNYHVANLPQDPPVVELSTHVIGKTSVERLGHFCDSLLEPYRMVDYSQCTAVVNNGCHSIKVGEVLSVAVFVRDSLGTPCPVPQNVTVELGCTRFGNKIDATVVEHTPSCYNATVTPTVLTRGCCRVVVCVNDSTIGGTPIPLFIECPPQMMGNLVHMFNNVPRAQCVRVVNNRLLCATSLGLGYLDLKTPTKSQDLAQSGIFPKIRKFKKWQPGEMAVCNDGLYVSDTLNCRVHKFKINGEYVRSTDKETINTPNGLDIAQNGNVYVCDSDSHCIHVFSSDLELRLIFGSQGSKLGQFNWPDTVAFDSSGNFYVTELLNHRVQCFTREHDPKWCMVAQEHGLYRPNVMHVVGTSIFVTDHHSVVVFNTEGQLITRFGAICAPADGITVDEDGFVYVSDIDRNRIGVF